MAADRLYLHEVVDIVGQGAGPYMEHVVRFDAEAAAGRGLTLLGTWTTVGATGSWPQVVNLWELVNGWEGWRALTSTTNVRRAANVALATWWKEAYRHRTGGFDRLLRAAPGCPSLAELRAEHVTGELFVHEVTRVHPGTGTAYLAAMREEWQPVMTDHGHVLVGLYEVLMTDVEVVTVWATTLDAQTELACARDERIARWREHARAFTARWREELMTPGPGTPLAP